MYKKDRIGIFGIIITIVILILLVILSNIKLDKMDGAANIFSKIFAPIQNGITMIKNKISNNNDFFINLADLKLENEKLKSEIMKLEEAKRELDIVKAENKQYREYMNLTDEYIEFETVPGYVIEKSFSNYSKIVTINIGKTNGLEVNMPVVSKEGLVGHIISVSDNSSKVQLLIDSSNCVSAISSNMRTSLVARGVLNEEVLKGINIEATASINVGEKIETSGLGGIYPKGILIGEVKEVKVSKNIMDRYVYITPSVNFEKLENILVIKSVK